MTSARFTAAWILVGLGTWTVAFQSLPTNSQEPDMISGVVVDDNGPVAGALVRVQATKAHTTTGADGAFTLGNLVPERSVQLTAFATGYYIAGPVAATPGGKRVMFRLVRHAIEDDATYRWVTAHNLVRGRHCERCHSDSAIVQSKLPFDEWRHDAHATSAVSRRFLSMYNGTDLSGQLRSPDTRYAYHADYGKIPLPPDSGRMDYGPGVRLDASQSPANCGACHAPAAATDNAYAVDPNALTDVGREGVTCDLCHKVWRVKLDPAAGLPYPDRPGVLSMEFLRPSPGRQLFIGPFDDAAPGDDTYSPLLSQSEFCAPCHFGEFWGVSIYNSFGEWLNSSFSNARSAQTCQDCHMPRRGAMYVARADAGGLRRDPETIFSHLMPGASDRTLLRQAARIEVKANWLQSRVHVEVRVTNQGAGHHIPTDHPARNMLLVVSATDIAGTALSHLGDQVIPDWAGLGSDSSDYGRRPGKGYAKVLEEIWTGITPTAAYWRPTKLHADTRIPANATDITSYEFLADAGLSEVWIEASLIYRRAFKELAIQKGWGIADEIMATSQLRLRRSN